MNILYRLCSVKVVFISLYSYYWYHCIVILFCYFYSFFITWLIQMSNNNSRLLSSQTLFFSAWSRSNISITTIFLKKCFGLSLWGPRRFFPLGMCCKHQMKTKSSGWFHLSVSCSCYCCDCCFRTHNKGNNTQRSDYERKRVVEV